MKEDETFNLKEIVNEIVEKEKYKYNKDVVLQILTALAEGQGRIQACKLAGISYETFTVWMEKKSDFSDAVKRAEKIGAGVTKDICQRRIIEDKSWQSAAWWLERKHPEEYAQSNNLNINIEKPAIIVGSEKAKDILDKLSEE